MGKPAAESGTPAAPGEADAPCRRARGACRQAGDVDLEGGIRYLDNEKHRANAV